MRIECLGAKVDLAHHMNLAKIALHEVISLDDAVAKGVELLDEKDSLVVVTADHSHPLTITGFSSRGSNILGKLIKRALSIPEY